MEILRNIRNPDVPSYYKEKPWQKRDRLNESKRRSQGLQRDPNHRSLEEMKQQGAKFSQTAGVELKFENDDEEVDWNKKISWDDSDEIVKRYDQDTLT